MNAREAISAAAERLVSAKKLLVTAHRGPDGDAVGSMIALVSLLRAQGKEATLYSADLVPRNLRWLPLTKTWVRSLNPESRYEITLVVDCGDAKLLGKSFPPPEVCGDVVVLDHHANARPFGDLFVSDPSAASTGVIVFRIAQELGWELNPDAALALYVSLVSDTGSFRYSNTNPEALRIAAELVERYGVSPWQITERTEERVPLRHYRLLSQVLSEVEVIMDGKVALMTVTSETIRKCEASWEDTEGLVNYARSIEGVDCGVLLTPAKWGGIRVSMRSKCVYFDAGAICHELGGGGHPGAAGCTLQGKLKDARKTIEDALTRALAAKAQPAAGGVTI